MKRHSAILAGTALGLLMASAPLGASPLRAVSPDPANLDAAAERGLILVQGSPAIRPNEDEEAPPPARAAEPEAEPQAAPEPEPAQAEQPAPEPQARPEPPEPEAEATPERTPDPEPAPDRQAETEQAPAEEAPARAEERPAEEAPPQAEQQPAEKPAEQQAEPEQAPAAEEPARAEEKPAQQDRPRAGKRSAEEPAGEQREPARAPDQRPAGAEEAPQEETPARAEQPADRPAGGEQAEQPEGSTPDETRPDEARGTQPREGEAPILDSAKEQRRDGRRPRGEEGRDGQRPADEAREPRQPVDAGPPPQSDAAAQEGIQAEEIQPATAEEGRRIEMGNSRESRREARRERRERRDNVDVVREFDDNRTIVKFNNQVFIESRDYDRLIRDDDDVYYEELPRNRTREVVTRRDGSRVVTVRNRYGDVIRRSRILPDNREVVLVYVEDRYQDDVLEWRDPADDLPPLVLKIPREEYILEAERVRGSDDYYAFFEQPPVERVTRTYSIDEVKRSARVRDIIRRVDLDTINFEFGADTVSESEIAKLEGVAQAMERILDDNPGETFLIEGHTDAVGSDLSNLALSDRRAESVAEALTNVFGIPPENLTTQGYGEEYLKVDTQERERENRRVAIRRITPLVAPVAKAN